jgi:hypothetical protein
LADKKVVKLDALWAVLRGVKWECQTVAKMVEMWVVMMAVSTNLWTAGMLEGIQAARMAAKMEMM